MPPCPIYVLYTLIISSFKQFPHENFFYSKNHANIVIFMLFSNFNFIFRTLPGSLPIEDLNISTEQGATWC
jgi:hypothetical protein